MDSLPELTTSNALLTTGTLGAAVAIAAMLGLFSKNHFPAEGRTILITGASEGMGRSVAVQLAAKGAHIILVARNVGRLEEALLEVKAAASSPSTQRFTYLSADVSEPGYAARLVAEAIAWNGGKPLDTVFCVAGLATPMLFTDAGAMAATRHNMDVNYYGAAELAHAIVREWVGSPSGGQKWPEPKHLIFTSSVAALLPIAGYATYTPGKVALRGLADTLAMELRLYPDTPVKVHVVYPATIISAGLERENQTKPGVTHDLESDDTPLMPDVVARRSIAGLERGEYFVTTNGIGYLLRIAAIGSSEKNNWVLDTLIGWVMPLVYLFVMWDLNGRVTKWSKTHGRPEVNKLT